MKSEILLNEEKLSRRWKMNKPERNNKKQQIKDEGIENRKRKTIKE